MAYIPAIAALEAFCQIRRVARKSVLRRWLRKCFSKGGFGPA